MVNRTVGQSDSRTTEQFEMPRQAKAKAKAKNFTLLSNETHREIFQIRNVHEIGEFFY